MKKTTAKCLIGTCACGKPVKPLTKKQQKEWDDFCKEALKSDPEEHCIRCGLTRTIIRKEQHKCDTWGQSFPKHKYS